MYKFYDKLLEEINIGYIGYKNLYEKLWIFNAYSLIPLGNIGFILLSISVSGFKISILSVFILSSIIIFINDIIVKSVFLYYCKKINRLEVLYLIFIHNYYIFMFYLITRIIVKTFIVFYNWLMSYPMPEKKNHEKIKKQQEEIKENSKVKEMLELLDKEGIKEYEKQLEEKNIPLFAKEDYISGKALRNIQREILREIEHYKMNMYINKMGMIKYK